MLPSCEWNFESKTFSLKLNRIKIPKAGISVSTGCFQDKQDHWIPGSGFIVEPELKHIKYDILSSPSDKSGARSGYNHFDNRIRLLVIFWGIEALLHTHILISQRLELYLQINGSVFQRERHQQSLPLFFTGLDMGHCLESLVNVSPFSGLETTTFCVLECCVKPSLYFVSKFLILWVMFISEGTTGNLTYLMLYNDNALYIYSWSFFLNISLNPKEALSWVHKLEKQINWLYMSSSNSFAMLVTFVFIF